MAPESADAGEAESKDVAERVIPVTAIPAAAMRDKKYLRGRFIDAITFRSAYQSRRAWQLQIAQLYEISRYRENSKKERTLNVGF